jgi:hypothetical protein
MHLNEYKLGIPTVSLDDWQIAIESASGQLRNVLAVQSHGARLLRTINEAMATTERIGWLNIWSKTFAALEAIAASLTHRSRLVLLLSHRTTFELMLQMHTVLDPLRYMPQAEPGQPAKKEYALRSCIDRLRAYTAWCLWHDKSYYKEVLNPKSMRDIWACNPDKLWPRAARAMPIVEQCQKKVNLKLDETTMIEGSRTMRKIYNERIRRIDEWMADPKLKKWAAAIEQASKKTVFGVPFFSLFDRADASIPKRLIKEGLRFSYASYIVSSMASHGSSMEEYIAIQNESIQPKLTGGEEQIENLASEVIFRCLHIFTLLGIINQEMANNPLIR